MPRTRAASRSASSAEPNVLTTSQRAVPASRFQGSSRYAEWRCTPASASGGAPCRRSGATPPTSVDRSPCTRQTIPSGSNQPGPAPTRAMSRTHSGAPVGSPETRARNAAWVRLVRLPSKEDTASSSTPRPAARRSALARTGRHGAVGMADGAPLDARKVLLTCPDGASVELRPTRYQFAVAPSEPDDWDANWLEIYGRVRTVA